MAGRGDCSGDERGGSERDMSSWDKGGGEGGGGVFARKEYVRGRTTVRRESMSEVEGKGSISG